MTSYGSVYIARTIGHCYLLPGEYPFVLENLARVEEL